MKTRPLESRRVSSSQRRARVARSTSSRGTSKPHRTSSAMACLNIGGWVIDDDEASGPNQADGGAPAVAHVRHHPAVQLTTQQRAELHHAAVVAEARPGDSSGRRSPTATGADT